MYGPQHALTEEACPTGKAGRIIVIFNIGAGSDEKQRIRRQIEQALIPSADDVAFVEVAPADDFLAICEREVMRAKRDGALVAAAGGDGTINTVAALCSEYDVPLGVIPLGTFNYFARELNIPTDPRAAAEILLNGRIRNVTVGYVNQHLFLNNASFGLYSRIIREREQDKSRFGRFRVVAVLSAVATLLRGQRPFAVRMVAGGAQQVRRTSMVFVGNNTLQLDNLELEVARCARENKLAVVLMRPTTRIGMMKLLWRGAFKSLDQDENLEMFCAETFEMETRKRRIDVVIDGEIVRCHTPLSFRVARVALKVMAPVGTENA
jgi:diacylglycerol kinase family enzyme